MITSPGNWNLYQIVMETQLNKVFPGLMCDSLEFFNTGKDLMYFNKGRLRSFKELPFSYVQVIREKIKADPAIQSELMQMHPDSEMKRIEQFAICNFSGLDHEPDIQNGILQEGEYWNCPMRGSCIAEGILCKPLTYNGQPINAVEITMIKLLVTKMTNETIADTMLLPLGTFHMFKKHLYDKLKISTKQELTRIADRINII